MSRAVTLPFLLCWKNKEWQFYNYDSASALWTPTTVKANAFWEKGKEDEKTQEVVDGNLLRDQRDTRWGLGFSRFPPGVVVKSCIIPFVDFVAQQTPNVIFKHEDTATLHAHVSLGSVRQAESVWTDRTDGWLLPLMHLCFSVIIVFLIIIALRLQSSPCHCSPCCHGNAGRVEPSHATEGWRKNRQREGERTKVQWDPLFHFCSQGGKRCPLLRSNMEILIQVVYFCAGFGFTCLFSSVLNSILSWRSHEWTEKEENENC